MERKRMGRGGIRSAGYDRNRRELEVEFESGSIVCHLGVGEEIARGFLASAAPASYYKDNIEEEFGQRRVK